MRETGGNNQGRLSRAGMHPAAFSVIVIVGFGLYRGVNSNAYLSAFAFVESPFLFMPDLFFNVVVGCSVIVCSAVAVALALSGRLKANAMPYVLPTVLLLASNVAALVGVILSLPADVALLVPGLLYGAGTVMLSLFWIEVFAAGKPSVVVVQIALGMLLNVVVSSALSPLSGDAQMRLGCVLLLVAALCAWFVRRQLLASDSEEGIPGGESEASGNTPPVRERWGAYRDAFLELGDSLVAFFVLEAVIGLLNSFMLAGSIDFEGSGAVSLAAIVGAIVVFCFFVFVAHRIPKVSTVSGVVMPVLAAMLVFLPFLSEQYNLMFSLLLLGSYWFVALLVTYLVAEVAHARGVSSYVLMGVAMGVARVCLVIALLAGYAAAVAGGGPSDETEHMMRYLVIIVVVLYALCMSLVFFSRDRKRRRVEGVVREGAPAEAWRAAPQGSPVSVAVPEAASGPMISPPAATPPGPAPAASPGPASATPSGPATAPAPAASLEGEPALEACCDAVAREGGLTDREAEVLVYLARGRTKAYIADALFVSENTVRSHVRNIYSKLGVHTRQQLLDLLGR